MGFFSAIKKLVDDNLYAPYTYKLWNGTKSELADLSWFLLI